MALVGMALSKESVAMSMEGRDFVPAVPVGVDGDPAIALAQDDLFVVDEGGVAASGLWGMGRG
ncbi:hypothetical protein [Micromonospora sp. LOL_021]|uniref:hypothetical protein n=1 Tax=Micromonospora sp. LOL_021 TaxID=3345417 RepID=UPI003A895B66